MFKYSKDGISVLSVLDARRAKKSGLFPVKIQVIYNRKQKYYSTGQELSKEDWANLAESKSRRLSEIRSSVENSFSIIKSQVESLAERGEFGFDLLSIRLGRCATVTVNAAVRAKIADAERNEQYSTRNGYHSMLLGIEAFAGKDIPFSTITIDWLNRLERFWSNDGKSKSTINVYFKYLKAILNQARMDGVIKEVNFPFGRGRFEMPSAEGRKLALTLEQIKKLITYTDGNEETEMYRDMWFFSYLCNGINFRDMLYLTYDNIEGDEICFVRAKTKNTSKQIRTIRAVLTPEMRNIIERWGNADDGNPDTLLFKFANNNGDHLIAVAIVVLYLFLICYGSEKIENDNKDSEGGKVMPYLQKCSTFQIDRAHNLDIVARRQNDCKLLCPLGHRTNRCKQATQIHKDYNKEEHHKHCLLDIIR